MGSQGDDAPLSFEGVFLRARGIPIPTISDSRQVEWCVPPRLVGIARAADGRVELFLGSGTLTADRAAIARRLRSGRWRSRDGADFIAVQVALPHEDHFLAVAALLVVELARAGAQKNLQRAFLAVEPLLELALQQSGMSDDFTIGLHGELRVMEALLVAAHTPEGRSRVVYTWRGHERSARDFVLPGAGVEVKATLGKSSSHRISSIGQADPKRDGEGTPVEELYLVSIGIESVLDGEFGGRSLVQQVDQVLSLLETAPGSRTEAQDHFLEKLATYGGPGRGYDHSTMASLAPFRASFRIAFTRIYDMRDTEIQVLRRVDVQQRSHVDVNSVSYVVHFPDRVTGDINPRPDLFDFCRRLMPTFGEA